MNQAFLRPPLPLYRVAAFATLPLLLWLSCHIALSRLGPLQTLYWNDYVRTTLPVLEMPSFVPSVKAKREYQVLLCSGPLGREVPLKVDGQEIPSDARLAAVPMASAEFNPWLRQNIYGGRVAVGFLIIPVMLSMVFVALLAGVGFIYDQRRHVAFRSTSRHISGPELVTAQQFNAHVKGDGVGFVVERGLWRKPAIVRIEREVEPQHQLMQGDNGAGKTIAMFALADQFEAARNVSFSSGTGSPAI
jgi:hypothetical protein